MRTTVNFDDDVAAAIDRLRRDKGLGLSEAANHLIRRAMASTGEVRAPYVHRTAEMGMRIDVTDIGDVLDLLDDEASTHQGRT